MKSIKTFFTIAMIVLAIPVFAQSKTNSNAVNNKPSGSEGTDVNNSGRQIDTLNLTPEQKAELLKKKQESSQQVNKKTVVNKKGTTKKIIKKDTHKPTVDTTDNAKKGPTLKPKPNGQKVTPSGNKPGFKATPVKKNKATSDTSNHKPADPKAKKVKVVKTTDKTKGNNNQQPANKIIVK